MTADEEIQAVIDQIESTGHTVATLDIVLHCHACNEEMDVEYDVQYEVEQHDKECDSLLSEINGFDPVYTLDVDIGVDTGQALKDIETTVTINTEAKD